MTYLDTQVVIWIYEGRTQKIPAPASREIARAKSRLISPMVELELDFLHRRKGLNLNGPAILKDLEARLGLSVCGLPFPLVVSEALQNTWSEDIFDRLIVSQAAATQSPLVTADAKILANYEHAVWD
jgi:PIN domain nuclease of toxin-antitoxin system